MTSLSKSDNAHAVDFVVAIPPVPGAICLGGHWKTGASASHSIFMAFVR
jgi:hypothetical protein